MTDTNQIQDDINLEQYDIKKLPSMLNVLTILTYVGCAIGGLFTIYGYFTACKSAETLSNQDMPEMGGFLGSMVDSAVELAIKQCENNLVLTLTALVGMVLCFVGAMMMRNLKKQGFILYLIGELLPLIITGIILGNLAFGVTMIFGYVISLLFVGLYASQCKFLTK